MGLLEVSFPSKVYNTYGNRFYFTVGGTGVLGDGTYDTIHSVIGEIQRAYRVAAEVAGYPGEDVVQI